MSRWLSVGAAAALVGGRLGSALRMEELARRSGALHGEVPAETGRVLLSPTGWEDASALTGVELREAEDDERQRVLPPTGERKRAHTEWWTLDPPKDRKTGMDLPQCCMHDECWRPAETAFRVPSYVGPAPANFTWDPNQLKQALTGKRVVLIGDSLMKQWFDALACYLTGAIIPNNCCNADSQDWDILETKIKKLGDYGLPTDYKRGKGAFRFSRMLLPDVKAEIRIYGSHNFGPHQSDGLLAMHARYKEEKADLVIINQGVHFNNKSNANNDLQSDLEGHLANCKKHRLNCVLRESTPQHFWYANMTLQSGLYSSTDHTRECLGSTYNESEEFYYDNVAEWRIEAQHAALANVGLPDNVMPVWEAMMPLTYAHPKGDCTHFKYNTEYWEPWHAAFFGLVEKLWY